MRLGIKRRFSSSKHVKSIILSSQKTYIPGFGGFSVYEVWKSFIEQLRKTSIMERASAISFNVVMSIPPIVIFVFTLIPHLPISYQVQEQLFTLIRDIVPGEENHAVIIDFLNDFLNNPRNELLSIGLFIALFFSSNAMMGVMRSFDKNYTGFYRRSFLEKRRNALMLTLIVFTLVLLCLMLLIAQGAVLKWLGVEIVWVRNLIVNVRWVFIVMMVFFCVSFIYRHGPALLQKWPFFTPGAIVATTFMVLATFGVSFWVNNFASYNKLYGSISAIFILMLLIFVNSLVVLLGFELNVTLANLRRAKAVEKKENETIIDKIGK